MTNKIVGLSSGEAEASKLKNGRNILEKEKTKGFFRRFIENLNDPIIKILIFALVVEVVFTLGRCNLVEVFGIVSAILLATTVSTVSELGSERAFLRMQEESLARFVRVLRDGAVIEIPESELAVGDVVYLNVGERIPADGIIISGKLFVDQSALNGESREVEKYPSSSKEGWDVSNPNRVFSGSVVTSGEGIVRIMRVGAKTFYGMVARDVQAETRTSPLKLRLSALASHISKIGYAVAVTVAFVYLFNVFFANNGFEGDRIIASLKDIPFLFSALIRALTLMITVVVVAAPEGLPMMITVVLSANMKRMMKDGVLVKKLVGIETAGSLNILFTDKTGTLTTGRLQCDHFVFDGKSYKTISSIKKNAKLYDILIATARYNTDAILSSGRIIGGNGTDKALLEFFKGENINAPTIVDKTPFSSESKRSSVTFSNGKTLIKGAPEFIISQCVRYLSENGEELPIKRGVLEEEFSRYAKAGSRVIAIAYKNGSRDGVVFAAFVVLRDKIRRGVKESVMGVKRAGVRVVMLTGDGKETASAIARECGILGEADDIILTSSELARMSDEEVGKILPHLSVLSRALPQDKTRLVRISQELDLVVGMTGDGINDAPSLKLADVGFGMGSGADIAKNAADIVLVDNGFFSINKTILYGRTIFKSIRKFITFQLIMNFAACGISLVGQMVGIETPITIIQMLWINIIMDTLGGLAFSGEPALEYYMKEKPKKRGEPILSKDMIAHVLISGAYTLAVLVAFLRIDFFSGMFRKSEGDIVFMTAFYALFIFMGIFNSFSARSERMWIFSNILKNKLFIFIMALISLIQVFMIYYGGSLFRSTPLLARELWSVILIAFSVVPFDVFRRIFSRLRRKK